MQTSQTHDRRGKAALTNCAFQWLPAHTRWAVESFGQTMPASNMRAMNNASTSQTDTYNKAPNSSHDLFVIHTFSSQITIFGHKFKPTGNSHLYKAMSLTQYSVLRLSEASLWEKVQMSHDIGSDLVITILVWSCCEYRSHHSSWIWQRAFPRSLQHFLQPNMILITSSYCLHIRPLSTWHSGRRNWLMILL
jgi:hypothetical protein